ITIGIYIETLLWKVKCLIYKVNISVIQRIKNLGLKMALKMRLKIRLIQSYQIFFLPNNYWENVTYSFLLVK
ncbi:MAG: hypothetical protein LW711_17065, partial [Saprospiraceae bacterium]|nr:hypothetical protein [Saprospiraceae bacterium]